MAQLDVELRLAVAGNDVENEVTAQGEIPAVVVAGHAFDVGGEVELGFFLQKGFFAFESAALRGVYP